MEKKAIFWDSKPFEKLSATELYAIIRLRNEVFVVEQQCVFQDADNKDQNSTHLMGWLNNELVAYTRIVPMGLAYPDYISIGRVVNSPSLRGTGLGKILMLKSIETCYQLFGKQPIKIGAQLYLKNFYGSLGFVVSGKVYDEDGIDHIEMILP